MTSVVADTHTAIWYLQQSPKLSSTAYSVLDNATQSGNAIHLASISIVEIVYLAEKGKLPQVALEQLMNALSTTGAAFVVAPLDLAVAQAVHSPIARSRNARSNYCSHCFDLKATVGKLRP